MQKRLNVLFVCARNQWRSPTAEAIFRNDPRLNVRSAGVSASARKQISVSDIEWADLICIMENKHKQRLYSEFNGLIEMEQVRVLDIDDLYQFMDPELIEILQDSIAPILSEAFEGR